VSLVIRNHTGRARASEVNRMAKILDAGGVIIAPTDTVYGLVGKAFDHRAFARLDSIKGERTQPYALVFPSVHSLEAWYGPIDPFRSRVLRALLPGPVTMILPSKPGLVSDFRYSGAGYAIRLCSDPLYSDLALNLDSPLWASSANRGGEKPPVSLNDIPESLLRDVDLAYDSGSTVFRDSSTVADIREFPFAITRYGPWSDRVQNVLRSAQEPLRVLVICTGNICRSPIFAGLMQHQLGCSLLSGVQVTSAGTNADPGLPPTAEMVQIAAEWGINISQHRSQQVTVDLVKTTDLILVSEPRHREIILMLDPSLGNRIRLAGETTDLDSIPDPYSESVETYRTVAAIIRRAAGGWVEELKRTIAESGWKVSVEPAPTTDSLAPR